MLFQFPHAIQAGLAVGKYVQAISSTGVPLSVARDAATGQFVGHAVGVLSNGVALNPLSAIPQMAMGAGQMYQMHRGFQAVQASLGVLNSTMTVIGLGVGASVALSAVNLYQTLKLRKAVERLELKVENGFIDLKQALKDQGAEIKQLIEQVAQDMKFEQHRLVLIRAYGLFNQAIHRLQLAMKLQDVNRRNAEIDAARGMLFEALADYTNPHLLEETGSAGQIRRLECAWAIDQTITATYQVQNEFAAASDRLSHLQHKIRQDALYVSDRCKSEDEVDFLFPEITRIHNHDLAVLESWQNHVDWIQALPPSELKLLQSADFKNPEVTLRSETLADTTADSLSPEQLLYKDLKRKSHYLSLRDQLKFMIEPDLRREHESYISQQATASGLKALAPSNWQEIPDLTVANLYWYFQGKQEALV
jgi:hypothetical protein